MFLVCFTLAALQAACAAPAPDRDVRADGEGSPSLADLLGPLAAAFGPTTDAGGELVEVIASTSSPEGGLLPDFLQGIVDFLVRALVGGVSTVHSGIDMGSTLLTAPLELAEEALLAGQKIFLRRSLPPAGPAWRRVSRGAEVAECAEGGGRSLDDVFEWIEGGVQGTVDRWVSYLRILGAFLHL